MRESDIIAEKRCVLHLTVESLNPPQYNSTPNLFNYIHGMQFLFKTHKTPSINAFTKKRFETLNFF